MAEADNFYKCRHDAIKAAKNIWKWERHLGMINDKVRKPKTGQEGVASRPVGILTAESSDYLLILLPSIVSFPVLPGTNLP